MSSVVGSLFRREKLLTVLDIGSTKTACMIASLVPKKHSSSHLYGRTHHIRVLGFGECRTEGVKSGTVVNIASVEDAIRYAVDEAETQADIIAETIVVNFSGDSSKSDITASKLPLLDKIVCLKDMDKVCADAAYKGLEQEYHLLHAIPLHYMLDCGKPIDHPLKMAGNSLGVEMHRLIASKSALRNLEICIDKAHLKVENFVSTAYATGLSVLSAEEAHLGAICLDIGGETTNISIFHNGSFFYSDVLAVGGEHITQHLANQFSTPLKEAEKLKVRFGSVLYDTIDDHHLLQVKALVAGQDMHQISRARLNNMLKNCMEDILDMVRKRLSDAGFSSFLNKSIVLTGGACELPGLVELAQHRLGSSVRIGRPLGISALPEKAKGPRFAALAGLLVYQQLRDVKDVIVRQKQGHQREAGPLRMMRNWLSGSF